MAGPGFTPVSDGPPSSRGSTVGSPQGRGVRCAVRRRIETGSQKHSTRTGTAAAAIRRGTTCSRPRAEAALAALERPRTRVRRIAGRERPSRGAKFGRDSSGCNPRFKLQYAIEDAGPDGPATVELWITQDGGRNWIRRGGDDRSRLADRGGPGRRGNLRVKPGRPLGLGPGRPAARPGDPPQTWVEVDSTPPSFSSIHRRSALASTPARWRSPGEPAICILPPLGLAFVASRSARSAWQPIVDGLENIGQYIWNVPPGFPAKFHLRVEAIDSVGHRGGAETTDSGPITSTAAAPAAGSSAWTRTPDCERDRAALRRSRCG